MPAHSKRSHLGSLHPWLLTLTPWGVALALCWVVGDSTRVELQASGAWPKDLDQDGLPDGQERILGTDSAKWDTDGDGFSDGYEFAAQSSPRDANSVPSLVDVGVNLTARGGQQDSARLLIGILAVNGLLDDKIIKFGAILGSHRTHIPFSFVLNNASHTVVSHGDGSKLFLFDMRLPGSLLENFGELTYFISAGQVGARGFESAAVADIVRIDGIACLRVPVMAGATYSAGFTHSVFRPIPGGGQELPGSWHPGALCLKQSEPQSQTGAVVTMFVTAAGCSEPWHGGSCPSDCGQSAGTTFTTIDPFVLIGG